MKRKAKKNYWFCLYILPMAVILVLPALAFSQGQVDSLLQILTRTSGKEKAKTLNSLTDYYTRNDIDKAGNYCRDAIELASKINDNEVLAQAYCNEGTVFLQLSEYESALKSYVKALKIAENFNLKSIKAEIYNGMGNAYSDMSNYQTAISNYLVSIKLYTELKNKPALATIYNNIAVAYDNREILDTALLYYNKALPIYLEQKNNAMELGLWYTNVGDLFRKQNKIDYALAYQLKAEKFLIEAKDDVTIMVLYSGMPYTYMAKKDYVKALDCGFKAVTIAKRLNAKRELAYAYQTLADVYGAMNNYKEEANYMRLYSDLNDSVFTDETSRAITDIQAKYENDKKKNEIELLKKDQEIKNGEIEKHKSARNFYIGLACLISLLVVGIAVALRNKSKDNKLLQRQKNVIEKQKAIVDLKNKEILDSINYAKRLQDAILPSSEFINKALPHNFVLYKPKDIVAGDFYFAEKINNKFFIAAADSTGHGVPGAMVSVVCSNALYRSLKEFQLELPGEILDKTRELVIETFQKSSENVMDGMDISLLCIDLPGNKVLWSGANNPLLYVRNNELHEIKAHKQTIGKTQDPSPFPTHTIELTCPTSFYLLTDGFADQFGGTKGKKFKYKQLKELILSAQNLQINEQGAKFDSEFEKWKMNFEQIDDVCIIGIKLPV